MAPANPPVAPKFAPKAQPSGATGVLVLADGTILWGVGYGASGAAVGEICFNTSMTGYQEILTEPSYSGQIETGSASCRERVCQDVWIPGVAVSIKKKTIQKK